VCKNWKHLQLAGKKRSLSFYSLCPKSRTEYVRRVYIRIIFIWLMVRSANKSIEKEKYENVGFKNILLRSVLAVIHPNLKSPFFLCWLSFQREMFFYTLNLHFVLTFIIC
jgi:hypothetical protein